MCEGAFIGLGARVIQCLTIGEWSTVGAGAVVRHDVPPGQTVVGVPARTLVRPTASRDRTEPMSDLANIQPTPSAPLSK